MWKYIKEHFAEKKSFDKIRADATFDIKLQDGNYHHLFTVKITEEGNIHTRFMVQAYVSKEVSDFIDKYNNDVVDDVYIPERERYLMLVIENELKWYGFSLFQPMTLSLYQTEKVMKQLYEIKYNQSKQ